MNRYFTALALISFSLANVSAQGTINYNINVPGSIVARVYLGIGIEPQKSGNTASQTPAGTTVYLSPMLSGSGWSAELYAAPGSGQPEPALIAVAGSLTTFRTGAAAGTFAPSILPVPLVPAGSTGTFQLPVWKNLGGTLNSWVAAEVAWLSGLTVAGRSPLFTIENLGPNVGQPANMVNFRSFNLAIPEPGVPSLLVLGWLGLHLVRRR